MQTQDSLSVVRKHERYQDFTFFDETESLHEFFDDKDFAFIQMFDITPVGDDNVVGFSGTFKWNGNTLSSLDGENDVSEAEIYGFRQFHYQNDMCVNILTKQVKAC